MKLSKWAKQEGISYITAYRWFKSGKLPIKAYQTDSGTIICKPESINDNQIIPVIDIYCRVSSHDKKDDLTRQSERCISFCKSNGWIINSVTKEIASGMNDNRPKLNRLLLSKPKFILVEHKDRLTRFGFKYFETLLPMLDCKLLVINRDQEDTNDLIKDLIAIITSFCCRLYGLRRGHNKSNKIKDILND